MSNLLQTSDIKNSNSGGGKCLTAFQRRQLQKKLQENLPESYRQRIQIMLLGDEGQTQAEICRALKCCPATVRHWMHVAHTGIAHQWQGSPVGRPKAASDGYLERLKELVQSSPQEHGYSFERWTGGWLSKHLKKEFGVELSSHHVNRLLKQMGLSTRQKRSNSKDSTYCQVNENRILIGDLKSKNQSKSPKFLSINLDLLSKDLETYG